LCFILSKGRGRGKKGKRLCKDIGGMLGGDNTQYPRPQFFGAVRDGLVVIFKLVEKKEKKKNQLEEEGMERGKLSFVHILKICGGGKPPNYLPVGGGKRKRSRKKKGKKLNVSGP